MNFLIRYEVEVYTLGLFFAKWDWSMISSNRSRDLFLKHFLTYELNTVCFTKFKSVQATTFSFIVCVEFDIWSKHCVKSVRIRSFSGQHFPVFGLNTERYFVSFPVKSECRKIWTRKLHIRTLFTQWRSCTLDSNSKKSHLTTIMTLSKGPIH